MHSNVQDQSFQLSELEFLQVVRMALGMDDVILLCGLIAYIFG